MAGVREYLKSAGEFFEAGAEHYESGRRSGSLMLMREGCEKVFHAYTEAVSALVQKRGLPEPHSHAERRDFLSKLGEKRLARIGDYAFLYLHSYAYYGGKIFPEVDKCLKDVDEAIRYVNRKIGKLLWFMIHCLLCIVFVCGGVGGVLGVSVLL